MVKVTQQPVAEPGLQPGLLAPKQVPRTMELQGEGGQAQRSRFNFLTTSLRNPCAAWAMGDFQKPLSYSPR